MNQLRLYTEATGERGEWERVCTAAGIPSDQYKLAENYPDDELMAVVGQLCALRRMMRPALMEEFGRFIVPALLRIYGMLLKPDWGTLDVIENTESVIHCVVRSRNPGASPPALETKRLSATEVHLVYRSPRQLCGLARGIAQGIALHLGERIEIEDLRCMHRGDPECVIALRLTGSVSRAGHTALIK
ncbi:MAG: heme NO-binding domain-containing protein [Chloroflexi bacterium]|nr:heme NO-binding domain-containing protein [Chloroflexota bacterium]